MKPLHLMSYSRLWVMKTKPWSMSIRLHFSSGDTLERSTPKLMPQRRTSIWIKCRHSSSILRERSSNHGKQSRITDENLWQQMLRSRMPSKTLHYCSCFADRFQKALQQIIDTLNAQINLTVKQKLKFLEEKEIRCLQKTEEQAHPAFWKKKRSIPRLKNMETTEPHKLRQNLSTALDQGLSVAFAKKIYSCGNARTWKRLRSSSWNAKLKRRRRNHSL